MGRSVAMVTFAMPRAEIDRRGAQWLLATIHAVLLPPKRESIEQARDRGKERLLGLPEPVWDATVGAKP